ncbi:hypothetical protein QBC42DRAFT_38562 [Cladorrhinum samala]|uniref:Uncharacterized protein n=1 Tax=Cladorrhinum samala TaxID=585594 RepID=A0AAV9H9H0_9PEZI|nr:hypothetical protein QBC42DRAFT_38562 [Cladorrhinum samala]
MSRILLRRGLLLPALSQPLISQTPLLYRHGGARAASSLADTSFWEAMIPKFMRRKPDSSSRKAKVKVKKDWNPATFFICIFLGIGSMSIQMIALKKDSEAFNRHADVRIGLLREVIEKIQNGEEVDVEKVLGTGDPRKEATWEEVLQDIAREEVAITQKKKKQAEAAALAEAQAATSLKAAPEPSQPARVQPVSELSTKGFF